MPIVDGKVTRARYTSLKLGEISSVDRPAQPGALASILKRYEASPAAVSVAKYINEEDGAHTFAEVLQENEFDEKIWPMVSALSQAIRSIMGDTSIKQPEREAKVTQSVDEFLSAVRNISPTAATDAEKKLIELISKKEIDMTELEKAVAKVAELTGQLTSANALATSEKARADAAEASLATEKTAHEETKKAHVTATDEVIKVDDATEVRKSIVGDAQFAVFKALDNKAVMATLEKRADAEFGHVVGTATEKALVLRARDGMSELAQKAFDAILSSAEQMAKGAFGRLGVARENSENVEKAQQTFKAKVAEIAKRDNCSHAQAMTKARSEFPDEHAAAYPPVTAAA